MTEAPADRAWPTELRFERGAKRLRVSFEDGAVAEIPFELLRVESPSAEVQGHGASGKPKAFLGDKSAVMVTRAEPVGAYAIRIVFDDGHDSGLFTWDYLRRLDADQDALLAAHRARAAQNP